MRRTLVAELVYFKSSKPFWFGLFVRTLFFVLFFYFELFGERDDELLTGWRVIPDTLPGLAVESFLYLIAELVLLVALKPLLCRKFDNVLWGYWVNPVSLVLFFVSGALPVLSLGVLAMALSELQTGNVKRSALFFGASSVLCPAPLLIGPSIATYVWQNRKYRFAIKHVLGVLAVLVIGYGIAWLGGADWLLHEIRSAGLFGENAQRHLLAASGTLVCFIYYAMWHLKRSSFDMFVAFCTFVSIWGAVLFNGNAYFILLLIPTLFYYVSKTTKIGASLSIVFFSISCVCSMFAASSSSISQDPVKFGYLYSGLAAQFALAAILTLRIIDTEILCSNFFRVSVRPFVISLTGDSGVGKTTLSEAITNLFGHRSVTTLHGDSYHKWDRAAPMWRTVTHLNPKANDIAALTADLAALIEGTSVAVRKYNHGTGRFQLTALTAAKPIILSEGLHALSSPPLRSRADVKIYIEVDEELRTYWKLQRDVIKRGHKKEDVLASIERRHSDAEKYIHSQMKHADLCFKILPVNSGLLVENTTEHAIPIKLQIKLRYSTNHEKLFKILIGLCGLQLEWEILDDEDAIECLVEGDVDAEDIRLAAKILEENSSQWLDVGPHWHSNMLGVMQLFVLLQFEQAISERC